MLKSVPLRTGLRLSAVKEMIHVVPVSERHENVSRASEPCAVDGLLESDVCRAWGGMSHPVMKGREV